MAFGNGKVCPTGILRQNCGCQLVLRSFGQVLTANSGPPRPILRVDGSAFPQRQRIAPLNSLDGTTDPIHRPISRKLNSRALVMVQPKLKSTPGGARAARHEGPLALPRRIKQWELVGLAAVGTLGQIYRAQPVGALPGRPAPYALKVLRPEWEDDPRAVGAICRESLVGRTVHHPHLISVLAAEISQSPYFVVMPWLTGTTLAQRLALGSAPEHPATGVGTVATPAWPQRATPPLPEHTAIWVARQAAEALDALHSAGWMHGDVKPSNLFLSPEGHVTLLDLGFARRPRETGSVLDRCVLGTCQYIAPELISSTLRADIRSDIYSLGVVLFEMLSGRLPFETQSLSELARQHREVRPPNLRRLVPRLRTGLVRLVREMLAKEPLRRPQTPRELIDRLVALEIGAFAEQVADLVATSE